ncbi:MAG TPA: alginate export family protein [Vicinamibacterales bacterium]|nr:alginate export family protein [Vicinamibacterales bacterium]
MGSALAALFLFLAARPVPDQPAQPPAATRVYLPNTADEDWTFLKDPSKRTDFWDPVKYIPLGADDRSLTLSGEIRYRPEGLRIHGVGAQPSTTDNYFLQRYLVGADLHFSKQMRLFGELQSGIINGKLGSPRPTDRDSFDLHQAFFEFRRTLGNQRLFGIRAGRQELSVGSSRLISASPGLNVKRSFDGVNVQYQAASWRLVGAAAELVELRQGAFNDRAHGGQHFWGVAVTRRSPRFKRGDLGLYYLGIDRKLSIYAQGLGPESRHTIGMKWSGIGTRFDLDYDLVGQWGHFNGAPVRAWAFAAETGYRLSSSRLAPRLSIRTDLASGDRDPASARLESFDPLFPGNSYSGNVGLFGPTNLTDLTPAFTLRPATKLTLGFEAPSYWRTSTGDGIYATDLRVLLPPGVGSGKYVGTNPSVLVIYQATHHLQLQGAITRMHAGGFLSATFVAKGFGFYSATALYRF